jgi:drug/metabolite transporter (DMT)-like permease
MLQIIILTLAFSITSAVSIVLIGGRGIIGVDMNVVNILKIVFSWQFILGACFAFLSRLLFLMINSAVYKIPEMSISSTTITMFITSIATIFVIAANYYFLGERLNFSQGVGAAIIFAGTLVIMR